MSFFNLIYRLKQLDNHFNQLTPMSWGEVSQQTKIIDNLINASNKIIEQQRQVLKTLQKNKSDLEKLKPRRVLSKTNHF